LTSELVNGDRPHLGAAQETRFRDAIGRFAGLKVLVVGDLMLDEFIWGEVSRISPEAPVPVVEVREETRRLGGSANVAANVAALGARVATLGVIGTDPAGTALERLLAEIGGGLGGLVRDPERPTTIKTRVIARQQQVVRFDRENRAPLGGRACRQLLDQVQAESAAADAVIVSDYGKGVVTGELMDRMRALKHERSLPILVDPKVRNADRYREVSLITPNHREAAGMSGIAVSDGAGLEAAGRALLEQLRCDRVLITRGRDGMSLFESEQATVHIPTVARRVFDVTGAGDTVIATMALGLAAGLAAPEAALLANIAAGIVVGEVGTAAVPAARLLRALTTDCDR